MTIDTATQAILTLLQRRGEDKTICPSEAARLLASGADFRSHMGVVKEAARALAADGHIEVLQKGHVIDIDDAHGPIRLRTTPPNHDRRSEP